MSPTVHDVKPVGESSGVVSDAVAQIPHFIAAEAELGSGLNQSLNRGHRADFSYLLALLSDNVVEHSAFKDFHKSEATPVWKPPFQLGAQVPLQSKRVEFTQSPATLFTTSRTQWRLHHALQPAGLHPVNNPQHIPAEVVANCAHYVQQRLNQGANASQTAPRAELLDVINEARGVERAVA